MRAGLIIVGILLLVAGIYVTMGNGSYKQTDTVAQLGPAKIEATHTKTVPEWAGIAGIVIGGLLVVGGFVSKKR
jgi:uncharacterized membrane protein